MIEIVDLRKKYGTFEALKKISLVVQSGEIFGFLGPNGAGKTTTIKILAGILKPTAGRALICGFDVIDDTEQAKKITGFIPDKPFIYEKLTARERQVLALLADGYANSEIAAHLHLSEGTVKNHVTHILEKMGARDRTHAVRLAVEWGLVDLTG